VSDEGTDFIIPIARPYSSSSCSPTGWTSFARRSVERLRGHQPHLAMAIVVIVIVQWYSIHVLGFRGYLRRFTKPFELPLMHASRSRAQHHRRDSEATELGLRLFGNIFGGLVMVYLLTSVHRVCGSSVIRQRCHRSGSSCWWMELFDVFLIGTIQAFIFMLLTIIYFGMAREGLEEHHGQLHMRTIEERDDMTTH